MCHYFDEENPNLDKNYEYNPRVFYEIVRNAEKVLMVIKSSKNLF